MHPHAADLRSNNMPATANSVRFMCENAASGFRADPPHDLVDRIEWIEENAGPCVGPFRSRSSFLAHAYKMLTRGLPAGAQLEVQSVCVTADVAVVTLRFEPFANTKGEFSYGYRWICRFKGARACDRAREFPRAI
jgi:hypothetical protein